MAHFGRSDGSGSGGATTGVINTGTDDESGPGYKGSFGPFSFGTDGETGPGNWLATLITSMGIDGESFTVTVSGTGAIVVGTGGESGPGYSGAFSTVPFGTDGDSFAASSVNNPVGQGLATTATNTRVSGAKDWTTVNNALSATDAGAAANISVQGTSTTPQATNANLTLAGGLFVPTATPTGWTRQKVETLVRAAWVLPSSALSSASLIGQIKTSGGTGLQTILNKADGAGSSGLTTVTTDVTTAVAGQTDAQLQVCQFVVNFTANSAAVTMPLFSASIDYIELQITYTRASIT